MLDQRIRVTEIFYSLQGETSLMGLPTVFVRLTGCPLRCSYCDTEYAFKGGVRLSIEEILTRVRKYNTKYICVTGGEPLAQASCLILLDKLISNGYTVSLETSGALDVSKVNSKVIKILDLKTPTSKESHRNLFSNLDYLSQNDQVKFVICNREDYDWAKDMVDKHRINDFCEVIFSPSATELKPELLAGWIIEDQLLVRFQIQLHKYLWGNSIGR